MPGGQAAPPPEVVSVKSLHDAVGGSLTGFTVIEIVAGAEALIPSVALNVKLSDPP
jgi:hypothetical protein